MAELVVLYVPRIIIKRAPEVFEATLMKHFLEDFEEFVNILRNLNKSADTAIFGCKYDFLLDSHFAYKSKGFFANLFNWLIVILY